MTLRGHPLFDAAGADAAGIEGVPFMTAGAAPDFVSGRLPLAEGTADAGTGDAGAGTCAFFCDYLCHIRLIPLGSDEFQERNRGPCQKRDIVQVCRAK